MAPGWRAGHRGGLGGGLPRDYFDVVCSVSVLEHLQHEAWPAAAEALRSCLRWGGLSAHCIDGKCRGRPGDHFEQMLLWKEFLLNTGLTWLDPPASLSSPSVFGDRGVWSMSEAAWRRWWASPGDEWDQVGRPVSINLAMTRPRFSPRRVLYGINRRLQGA
jgi:hypothetical protein